VKTQQLPLGGPVDRYFQRQSHQLLGGELTRIFAVNNRSDDIGRQGSKAQEAGDVPGRDVFLAGNSMQGQLAILYQAVLDVVSSSDDP
jgi:hypothetical protein